MILILENLPPVSYTHLDVQAFPDANHALSPDDDFKVIYGVEAYLVDDLKDIITLRSSKISTVQSLISTLITTILGMVTRCV